MNPPPKGGLGARHIAQSPCVHCELFHAQGMNNMQYQILIHALPPVSGLGIDVALQAD
jgi:hypothetical protein